MIRVSTFNIPDSDGASLKFASMSVAEAEAFVEEGRAMLDRKDEITAQEWLARRHAVILTALSKAGNLAGLSEEQLKFEFDNPTLDELYRAILKFSGLNPGEAPAATASATSAAA